MGKGEIINSGVRLTGKNKVRSLALASYKGKSKWIKGLNVQGKIMKLIEENIE